MIEFFKSEFQKFGQEENYYENAIANGLIRIDKKISDPNTSLKDNQLISHKITFTEN